MTEDGGKMRYGGQCHFCGNLCDICDYCDKSCCHHCDSHCNCKKKKKHHDKCNLCEKVNEGQCVLILTKNNNFIIGRIDRIDDCKTLKLENSLALPSCVICILLEALFGVYNGNGAAVREGHPLTICDLIASILPPFDTFVCCDDIDTITVLNGSPELFQTMVAYLAAKK